MQVHSPQLLLSRSPSREIPNEPFHPPNASLVVPAPNIRDGPSCVLWGPPAPANTLEITTDIVPEAGKGSLQLPRFDFSNWQKAVN